MTWKIFLEICNWEGVASKAPPRVAHDCTQHGSDIEFATHNNEICC